MASPSRHDAAAAATDDDLRCRRRVSVSTPSFSSSSLTARSRHSTRTQRQRQTTRTRKQWPSAAFLAPLLLLLLLLLAQPALAAAGQETLSAPRWPSYRVGQSVPVECLNRTVDTGEHITDASGQLQYVPFPVCNETGKPLELYFGVEQDLNCTIDFISDPLFHQLEFYVHNDAPLTCRVPSHPLPSSIISHAPASSASSDRKLNRNRNLKRTRPGSSSDGKNADEAANSDEYSVDAVSGTDAGALGTQSTAYTPLVIALAGTLQLSHLHIASTLNVLLHTSSSAPASARLPQPPRSILAATAYSAAADLAASDPTSPARARIVIGDALPLRLRVRWYDGAAPPFGSASSSSATPHATCSARAVLLYCALSAGAAVAVSFAWWRGVEMPRRLLRAGAGAYGYGGGAGKEGTLEGGLAAGMAKGYSGYGYNGYGVSGGGGGGGGFALGLGNGSVGGKRD